MQRVLKGFQQDPGGSIVRFFSIVVRGRTYLRLLYLALTLPLGGAYCLVLVGGALVGAALCTVGIGLLVLLAFLVMAWVFASFERELIIALVGVEVPPLSLPSQEPISGRRRLMQHLRQPTTWKSMGYLLLLVPFALFAWTVGGVLVGAPLILLLRLLAGALSNGGGFFYLIIFGVPLAVIGTFGLHLLDRIVRGWGDLAVTFLGVGDEERGTWEAEQRAAQAEKSRQELILNVSHELRTPIASIQGHLDSLLMPDGDRPPPAEWERYVTVAATEARRLGRLVDELLMLARADANELPMESQPTDLRPLLEGVVAALGPLARRDRRVTLICRELPEVPAVVDPSRFTQVVSNLVRNAINHTPEGGAVSLSGSAQGEWVDVAVGDTGTGISAEDLPRVFERFYRADAARTRDSGGFGLGLAIAKNLVEAMGGTIQATSEPGLGSTFTVRVPLAR
ncbi:MAG TPA: ATP-binding protein [Candidatus Dormibacteraeota bacterium]|jgi:signal transduction histidine kinase|nr:ATP-binding protein [Candidatus Dormibacteraeota bacterium]